jgi:2-iminobutanoate/2-iminopropanoate deaminase
MNDKKITLINAQKAAAAIGPYSHAALANGFLFLSGQLGLDPKLMLLPEGIEAQTHQALKNIQEILAANQKSFSNVVKTTIFLKNMSDFPSVNVIYGNYFNGHLPARSCVAVAELPKNALIEIEVIAY